MRTPSATAGGSASYRSDELVLPAHRRGTGRDQVLLAEFGERAVELGCPLGVRAEVAVHGNGWAVAPLEVVAEPGAGREWDRDVLPAGLEELDPVAEQRGDMPFVAPQRRGLRAGRRWRRVRLHQGEHLPDEAVGSPAEQADRAAGAADPHEL